MCREGWIPELGDVGDVEKPPRRLPCLTWGAGLAVVQGLVLLLRRSPVAAALLGIPALRLRALAGAGAHPAPLELLVVLDLQGGRGGRGQSSALQQLLPGKKGWDKGTASGEVWIGN